jgi:PHD/YefM family antitoxin component YafN of YafNO toxin-antitoxin module
LQNKHKVVINTMPMTEARTNLGAVAKRVHLNKEYFLIEKDGIPIIGIMDADELEDYLELQDPKARRDIEKSNEDIKAGRVRPARELLAELRGERKKQKASRS